MPPHLHAANLHSRWGEDCGPVTEFLKVPLKAKNQGFCYQLGYEQAVMNDAITSVTVGR